MFPHRKLVKVFNKSIDFVKQLGYGTYLFDKRKCRGGASLSIEDFPEKMDGLI